MFGRGAGQAVCSPPLPQTTFFMVRGDVFAAAAKCRQCNNPRSVRKLTFAPLILIPSVKLHLSVSQTAKFTVQTASLKSQLPYSKAASFGHCHAPLFFTSLDSIGSNAPA